MPGRSHLTLTMREKTFSAALDWLRNRPNAPFFMFLHTYEVHTPYVVSNSKPFESRRALSHNARLLKLSKQEIKQAKRLYDGECKRLDSIVGKLFQQLKSLGLYHSTVVVILSDHGEEFAEHGGWLHGKTLYEEAIRVPLLIKFPGS